MAIVLLPYNVQSTVYFPLVGSGTAAFSTAGSGSLVGTNVQVSKDGGALATSTNTGTVVGSGLYSLVLTTSELSAKHVAVLIGVGTLGTKVEHQAVFVNTYGNASAMFPFDFGTALSGQTVGTVTTVLGGTIGTVTGTVPANVTQVAGTAVAASAGTLLVNLVANQATATVGTALFVASGSVGTLTGVASANLIQILGTAAVGAAGTLTNVGTAGTALGTVTANVAAWLGTAAAGTQGTVIANLAPNQTTATLGLVNTVGTLGAQAKADVNAEMVDVMGTDTIAELTQGQPAATPSFRAGLMALYMALRNAGSSDGTVKTVANSAGTVVFKKTVADNGLVYTETSATSGP